MAILLSTHTALLYQAQAESGVMVQVHQKEGQWRTYWPSSFIASQARDSHSHGPSVSPCLLCTLTQALHPTVIVLRTPDSPCAW